MTDKIANTIALHQMTINELKELKEKIKENNCDDSAKFIIQTKEFDPFALATFKRKNKLDLSTYTLNVIIDEAIKKERERIDKLIDMEIEKRNK